MPTCPLCHQPASKRDGHDAFDRQRYACHRCGRDFTARSGSAFTGCRWPEEVILLAVRWSLSHPLSATSVMELLAERGIDVSRRTVLRWVQTFGPLLAAEVRKHRRPLGTKCYVDEVFFFRGKEKHYLYRAVDEHGQVIDVLFREHRDTESAIAFFRQVLARTGWHPSLVISDHHQPYIKAVQEVLPEAVAARHARADGYECQLLAVCPETRAPERPEAVLAARIRRYIKELFTFVRDPTVPATNNAAERSLRPLVIARKISGGTRSPAGSRDRMILASVLGTAQVRGDDLTATCLRSLVPELPTAHTM